MPLHAGANDVRQTLAHIEGVLVHEGIRFGLRHLERDGRPESGDLAQVGAFLGAFGVAEDPCFRPAPVRAPRDVLRRDDGGSVPVKRRGGVVTDGDFPFGKRLGNRRRRERRGGRAALARAHGAREAHDEHGEQRDVSGSRH